MLPILQSRRREAIELLALQQLHRGRVLDLNTRVGKQRITDLSPYGNNANLKSGVYFSTDGLADKGIGADCSAEGSGDYYYTARIRSSSTGTKWATIGGAAVSANLPSADVWTDVTFSTASSVTPSDCFVGWDGDTPGGTFSDCDWSEVKLWKVGVSDAIAYWPGCDSEAADLDGHFVADVSGNGYYGAHVGGSSGSGETDILQTAGLNWNKRLWYNGTDTSLDYGSPLFPATADFDETFYWYIAESSAPASNVYVIEQATLATAFFGLSLTSSGNIALVGGSGAAIDMILTSATPYYQTLVKVRITKTSGTLELYLNDVSIGT
jgi:hypothetical protein